MNVLRITRHPAQPAQMGALRAIFGNDVKVVEQDVTLPNGRELTKKFDELASGYDAVEAVLPAGMIESLLKYTAFAKAGRPIIKGVMNRVGEGDDVKFVFSHYERYKKVEIQMEQVTLFRQNRVVMSFDVNKAKSREDAFAEVREGLRYTLASHALVFLHQDKRVEDPHAYALSDLGPDQGTFTQKVAWSGRGGPANLNSVSSELSLELVEATDAFLRRNGFANVQVTPF